MSYTFPDPDDFLESCLQELADELAPPQPPQGDEETARRHKEEWRQQVAAQYETFRAALDAAEHCHGSNNKPA